MRSSFFLGLLLWVAVAANGQQFIGCRTDSGWAETPMLRTTFHIDHGELRHSDFQTIHYNLSVVSLGYHEVYVNNNRVGDDVLQPAVSQLDKRAMEVSYDISDLVHEGDNELMLWLGQGWGRIYGTPAVARAEVSKTVSDGECGLIYSVALSDSSWQSSPSPYSYTGSWQPMQFAGERYDARIREQWRPASVFSAKDIAVSRQEFEGNRIVGTLLPQRVDTLPDGTFLLDFGRVVTGWFQLQCLPIPEGNEITMEYLDHLEAKPPFTETDIYVSDGSGDDDIHFTNRFHMHSFRYVKVKGLAHYLTYGLDTPIVLASAVQISAVDPFGGATFSCSDPRLNAIHDMVKYTLSCLTFSGYMVDCPHIERMGYGGDGNSSTNTLQTFWDVRDTYINWLQAWSDAMQPDGELPYAAPAFRTGGGPYWQSFIVQAPWHTYLNYDDRSLIYRHYNDMKRWLQYIERHHPETHSYANGTPLDQCYALLLGIPPDSATAAAVKEQLLKDCHGKYRDHIAAGLMGVPIFTQWCIQERETDLMATILRQPDYPGYLNMMDKECVNALMRQCVSSDVEATTTLTQSHNNAINNVFTTWESWDCGRPGKEDRSRVHNCYNGIGIWFYQALAGIRPDPSRPGYKHFFFDPQPCKGVDWVKCTKPTPFGTICVEISNSEIKLTVPDGTTATLFPGSSREQTLTAGHYSLTF